MVPVALPVFWVGGASAAGKSVAAWDLALALVADGTRVGYVDIDQLGMLYPASPEDPARHLLKEEALVALVPGYASAGAQVLVVSGVTDPAVGPAAVMLDSGVDLTLCALLADPGALRARIQDRGWDQAAADEAVAENAEWRDSDVVDATLDTAGLSAAQTVERLRPLVQVARERTAAAPVVPDSPRDMRVVIVTGPRAVGTSTIGFGLAMSRWQAELRTGFVDLQQLSFLGRRGSGMSTDSALGTTQLAAMHTLMAARGAGLLVVSGHLGACSAGDLRHALGAAPVTVVRLRADAATLRSHLLDRIAGDAARLAGDDLLGADADRQAAVLAAALTEQAQLDAHADDDAVLDVSDRTPADVVSDIERLIQTM